MTDLFFYGTLRHTPLLECVLGRPAKELELRDAVLPGYRVSAVAEGPFPMIAQDAGAEARGLLVRGLGADDLARLDFYEGSFAYDLTPVTLADGQSAQVYVPQPDLWTADGPWSLSDWVAGPGAVSLRAAREVMSYFGQRSRDEVAQMFDMIRARAASELRAEERQPEEGLFSGRVEVETRVRSYARFFALDDMRLRHERFDGTMSDALDRAVFVGCDAALVLPYDPGRDRVLLVEQMRMGPLGRGDPQVWQLEPIAGRVDPGETPQEAARREGLEEANLVLDRLEVIAEAYPSPGTSTEFFYVYLAPTHLPDDVAGTGGLSTEHENIRSHLLSFEDFIARADAGRLSVAPLVLAAYYLARHRDRLRSDWAKDTPESD